MNPNQKYLHEMVMLQICIFIKDSRIDFICTHPPYANIIKYSKGIEGDISLLAVDEFLSEMKKVADESFRVLKKGKCVQL